MAYSIAFVSLKLKKGPEERGYRYNKWVIGVYRCDLNHEKY